MLDSLKIAKSDVEEDYDEPTNNRPHFNRLTIAEKSLVKNKRVELDSLLAYSTPQDIWEYARKTMSKDKKRRDLTRSMELNSPPTPTRIKTCIDNIQSKIMSLGSPILEREKKRYSTRVQPIRNIPKIEKDIMNNVESQLQRKEDVKRITTKLEQLVKRLKIKGRIVNHRETSTT